MGGSRSRAPLRRVTCSARRPGSRSARPAPLRAFYERLRAPQGAQIAPVVTARKRCVLFWHLLTCEQDYAFERPSHRGGSAGVCPIKGVGPYTAMLVIGEVGDVGRFRSAPPPLRLGQPDADPALIRRHGAARAHLQPRLGGAALGARRGRPDRQPLWRAAARDLRADRPSAAAARSPRSRSRARSSPSATTRCTTARFAASPADRTRRMPRRPPDGPPRDCSRSPAGEPAESHGRRQRGPAAHLHGPHPAERRARQYS
jgi:hypothetical protein